MGAAMARPIRQPGRRRRWRARFVGDNVIVRNYIDDLQSDEDVQDDPPTEKLTRVQWEQRHLEFGLAVDGTPLPDGPA